MKKIFLLLCIAATAIICTSFKTASPSMLPLLGTTWIYTDEDKSYEITFLKNNVLSTTNPNNNSPEDDSWKQTKKNVYIFYSKKYATYKGTMVSEDLIKGTAKNVQKLTWTWELKRKK